jgi:signal transduction histidine kinase/ligand-binding sensor domain-containing protein
MQLKPTCLLRRGVLWFSIAVISGAPWVAPALEPTTPLASFSRQIWVMENGLPQNTVQTLLQTRDGFLWLGTEVGLVRFDGNGFRVFDRNSKPALPGNDIRCLLEGGDGTLWIGTSEGLARMQDGSVSTFSTSNGLPGNDIQKLELKGQDTVLVSTGSGVVEVKGDRVVNSGLPDPAAGKGKPGSEEVEFRALLPGAISAVASRGAVVLQQPGKPDLSLAVGKELPGTRLQALLGDREGSLWIGTNRGLARWVAGKIERLPVTDPLASASVLAILADREGNLWVGTEAGGLHILRDQRFHTIGAREGLSSDATTTVVEDKTGTLWVGTSGNGLNALKVGEDGGAIKSRVYSVHDGLLSDVILSLASAPNGDLWVGTPDGLNRIRGGNVQSFTSADGLPDDFIRSLLADADGSLWVGTRRGLTHWTGKTEGPGSDAHIETYTHANGLGSDLVGSMARDMNGDLWVATFAGLSRLHNGQITNYTTADGLSSNVITSLLAHEHGMLLIGTQDHGWNLWDGKHISSVKQIGLDTTTIHAILDDGLAHLWFATGTGIARCDCSTPQGMQSADCAHWVSFGTGDGLRSRETATNSHPSAWRAHDGHLWFATPKGLVEVDPAHFPVNLTPPPVAVERFAVDDVDQASHAEGNLEAIPAGHNHFQFDYAGLSFIAPQKVRYRYMLEGFDHEWTEAGVRRTAYYTNIRPGKYTFRVQAANNDGVWNTEGAALRFELRPHFYQTAWFYVLLALVVASLIGLLLKLRLVRAEREFNAVLGERNRIAREIHDTLAQGYVGVSVQLEVLSELLRHQKVEAATKHLDTTRGYVREGLADARQSIWALRSQDAGETTLPVRMRRLVEQAGGHGLEARFSIYGAYRPLPPGTEREILRVAQEAIHNVRKHAGATNLAVQLEYGPREIALEIRDDGRGFVAGSSSEKSSEAYADSTPGHYGLMGMRERAAAIGGTLEITSEPGTGTTVRLRAPGQKGIKEQA